MRFDSPKPISIIVATVATAAVLVVAIVYASSNTNLAVLLLGIIGVLALVYFVTLRLISQFVFQKINPIYKTIYSLNVSQKNLKKDIENKDIVSEVNQEVLQWANKKSQEINKLKELEGYRKEFLGNVSHELKTPIFNIQGYVLTLLDGALDDPTINRKYLERTEKSINRLISIVDDLESISKLESKVLKLVLEKVNIVQLVHEVFEAQEMRARKKDIKLMFDKEYTSPIWVVADKKRIYQALVNLVVNSINYGKEGGKTKVSFMDVNENILVEVNDNGIGISREDIPRVFERFYRVDKSRSREQGGTGLGLAIVKHIIEAHGQSVNVSSSLNEGTSFTVPLAKYRN
jgi:two-component system, OmpR family, phosphate regulon sensor histidine kinase PhoR